MKPIYVALVALTLATTPALTAPARAENRDYRINVWVADDRTVLAYGHIQYAARAVGVPIFLALDPVALMTTWRAIPGSGVADGFCNLHPEGCAPVHFGDSFPTTSLTTVSAEWAPSFFAGGDPRLILRFPLFTFPSQISSEGLAFEPFALTIPVPGPIAGTGLPALAVGLFAALFTARRKRRS